MINDQTLDQAIIEATRFIKAAKALRAARKMTYDQLLSATGRLSYGVESGAAKRASMDLTRKLADLRQGR